MPGPRAAIDKCVRLLADARAVVVATGAGMSQESGIPTFRDAPSALWEKYDPMQLATPEGFRRDPKLVWQWYDERRRMIAKAEPHAGHIAVVDLERLVESLVVVTQNIDNLHRRAGSADVLELHGNIFRHKCFDNEHPVDDLPATGEVPPRCACGSFLRPDVVWFGELLPARVVDEAYSALESCNVALVVGTSGIVHPAASFPGHAKRCGAKVIEINPEPSEITPIADVFVKARAGEALPEVVRDLERELRERQRS